MYNQAKSLDSQQFQIPSQTNNLVVRWLLVGLFLVILAVGFALPFALRDYEWSYSETLTLLLLCVMVLAASLNWIARGKLDVFEPIYMFAVVFFIAFVLAGVIIINSNYLGPKGAIYRSELSLAFLLASAGLLGLYMGYMVSWPRFTKFWQQRPYLLQGGIDPRVGYIIAMIMLAIMVGIFLLWLRLANLSFEYLNALDEDVGYTTATTLAETNVLYFYLVRTTWPLIILISFRFAPNRFWQLVSGVALTANIVIYTLAANRSSLFSLIVSVFVMYYLNRQKQPKLYTVVALITLFVVSGSYLVLARGHALVEGVDLNEASVEITERGAITGIMSTTYVFPYYASYMGLGAVSDVLYAPIPRVLWPGKPVLRAVQTVVTSNAPVRAHAVGILGIFYAGFGPFGPLLILLFYGVVSAFIYEMWRHRPHNPLAQAILAGWLPFIWVLVHRGELSKHLVITGYSFGPVIIIYFVSKWLTATLNKNKKNVGQTRIDA